jgi:aminoglycoside phosphotransferase family enzyme
MNQAAIRQLQRSLQRQQGDLPVELVETHISWVLVGQTYAYKIKKPVLLSFLDFSTPAQRRKNCEREVILNRRYSPELYLGVVSIVRRNNHYTVVDTPAEADELVDYAVKMQRLDQSYLLNRCLDAGDVTSGQVEQLARVIADFHRDAAVITTPPDIGQMQALFADIRQVEPILEEQLGPKAAHKLESWIAFSGEFLAVYAERIQERHKQGFTIDGHGDLHAGNIFLLDPPVLFDCIEFNDTIRRADVLSELAFLCMDFDFYGRSDLANSLLEAYHAANPCLLTDSDRALFQYYKFYRANIRLKINALKAQQATTAQERRKRLAWVEDYYWLLNHYANLLINPFYLPHRAAEMPY